MPLLNVFTSAPAGDAGRRIVLMKTLSALLARELDKPEDYVMVALEPRTEMLFAGTIAPACYAELKNIGHMEQSQVDHLSDLLCTELARGLGIARERVYIEFTNADGGLWGWNGATFA